MRVPVLFLLFLATNLWALTPEQLRALNAFKVVNSDGESAPPVPSERLKGQWPFGVLAHIKGDRVDGYATASHFGNGTVVTASHNFMNDPDPKNYAVIFYDASGVRRFAEVESIPFDTGYGNAPREDFAVVLTKPGQAENWHAIEAKPLLFDPSEFHSQPPNPRPFDIWVSDPLLGRKDVIQKMGITNVDEAHGAVLGRRTAIGSRTEPVSLRDAYLRGGTRDTNVPPLYLDNFGPEGRGNLRVGNSGSVVTSFDPKGNIQVAGLVSQVAYDNAGEYAGNQGTYSQSSRSAIYSSGCVFQDLVERRLDFRHLHESCAVVIGYLANGTCR